MVQKVNQASKECEFTGQSGTQILNGMLVAACSNMEVNKWISENIIEITNMASTYMFEQTTGASYNVILLNKGIPNYDGKGNSSPKTNLNNVSVKQKKR